MGLLSPFVSKCIRTVYKRYGGLLCVHVCVCVRFWELLECPPRDTLCETTYFVTSFCQGWGQHFSCHGKVSYTPLDHESISQLIIFNPHFNMDQKSHYIYSENVFLLHVNSISSSLEWCVSCVKVLLDKPWTNLSLQAVQPSPPPLPLSTPPGVEPPPEYTAARRGVAIQHSYNTDGAYSGGGCLKIHGHFTSDMNSVELE